MATLADNGRITVETVDDEIARLRYSWNDHRPSALDGLPGIDATALDLFDRMQLENVVAVCRRENPFRRRAAAIQRFPSGESHGE